MTVKWKKVSDITDYEIQYTTAKIFKNIMKKVAV